MTLAGNTLKLTTQLRQVVGDGLPDDLQVHTEVLVDQDVPHARDINPWDAGRETSQIAGEVPNSLADDFKVAHNGVDGLRIGLELFETQTADVLFDFGDGFENVVDTKAPFPSPLDR